MAVGRWAWDDSDVVAVTILRSRMPSSCTQKTHMPLKIVTTNSKLMSSICIRAVLDLVFANPGRARAGFIAQLQLIIKKWWWPGWVSVYCFFPLVAPRLPETKSTAVIHCVVLMLHLARSRHKWPTKKFVVWNKYGIMYVFAIPAENPALAHILPEPDLEKPPDFGRSRNPVQP